MQLIVNNKAMIAKAKSNKLPTVATLRERERYFRELIFIQRCHSFYLRYNSCYCVSVCMCFECACSIYALSPSPSLSIYLSVCMHACMCFVLYFLPLASFCSFFIHFLLSNLVVVLLFVRVVFVGVFPSSFSSFLHFLFVTFTRALVVFNSKKRDKKQSKTSPGIEMDRNVVCMWSKF